MRDRPRLLDLFCCAGGCAVGYHRAGFDVTGVDLVPQPRFPFRFIQADALDFLREHGHEFDVIHASPPCQKFSVSRTIHAKKPWARNHPDLVDPTRDLLQQIGKPYVIENVKGAPLENPITLCGTMFGLRVYRHRLFESSISLRPPEYHPCRKLGKRTAPKGKYDKGEGGFITVAGHNFNRAAAAAAMQIDWPMTQYELAQCIPPVYTEYIGKQILETL